MMPKSTGKTMRLLAIAEVFIIVVLAAVPLLVSFPFRINIFLSWEGAYRMSHGQIPFRDFGTPLGGMYWVIPAIFFKLFGAKLITLVKAQVFINILAGLAFRSILSSLSVQRGIRFVSVLLFCISYSFFNFWPWYNHSVIVYELVGLAFLFRYFFRKENTKGIGSLVASAFFICCSFLTKQDGGGMAFMICCVLLAAYCLLEKKWTALLVFIVSVAVVLTLIILPLSRYGFGYWFNHGQAPHNSRVSVFELADEFFTASQWIKFYLFLIFLLLIARFRNWKACWNDKRERLFLLLTLCILGEAAVFQVTSYIPPDNNIFFHSFAFVFLLSLLATVTGFDFSKPVLVLACTIGVMLWWSGTYWKYIQRIAGKNFGGEEATVSPTGENIVDRKTYMINRDTTDIPMSQWVYCGLPSFRKIYLPQPTVDGIHRLMQSDLVKEHRPLKVLNMSELTPLAAEIPYELEKNPQLPLWFHLGVGMFNRQAKIYENRIKNKYYDLVIFEYIPSLNNFYPFRIRDSLKACYHLADSFMAPRSGDTKGTIEVYTKP